jgi:hypothetical protein
MKYSMLLMLAGITLSGCAVVPVPMAGPPRAYAYVRPPVIAVQPYGYGYADYRDRPYRHWH